MSAADLRRLHAGRRVVGTHSASHPARMSKLAISAILSAFHDSSARIADILSAPVVTGSGARLDACRRSAAYASSAKHRSSCDGHYSISVPG
jgi:hypothetical protein